MGRAPRGKPLKTLAYTLTLFGTLIVILAGIASFTRDNPAATASTGSPVAPRVKGGGVNRPLL